MMFSSLFLVVTDGVVYSAGQNQAGQLGLSHTANRSTPSLVPELDSYKICNVAAGASFSVLLSTQSEVRACHL